MQPIVLAAPTVAVMVRCMFSPHPAVIVALSVALRGRAFTQAMLPLAASE
jgi:hypothetical protein